MKGIALKPGVGTKNSRNLKHVKEEEEWQRLQGSIVALSETMEELSGLDSNFFAVLAGTIGLVLLAFAVCLQFCVRAMAVIDLLILTLSNVGNWLSLAKNGIMALPCVKACVDRAGRKSGRNNDNGKSSGQSKGKKEGRNSKEDGTSASLHGDDEIGRERANTDGKC